MDGAVCTINALPAPVYDGSGDFYYGRKDIFRAVSRFPFSDLLRDEHFLPADELQKLLSAQNMLNEVAHPHLLRQRSRHFGRLRLYVTRSAKCRGL